ncbi:hypothetical protein AWV79_08125 [Cupriavidus sp. UYMMa02A]|nr:hypothetical protein AWV79_08125 [Cupriavidus sp. UYMMa02A]
MDFVAQTIQQRTAQLGQLQRRQVVETEAQHRHAEPEFPAPVGPFDKAHHFERGQQPENGRARHLQAPRQLGGRQRALAAAEFPQQPQAALKPGHDVLVLGVIRRRFGGHGLSLLWRVMAFWTCFGCLAGRFPAAACTCNCPIYHA